MYKMLPKQKLPTFAAVFFLNKFSNIQYSFNRVVFLNILFSSVKDVRYKQDLV